MLAAYGNRSNQMLPHTNHFATRDIDDIFHWSRDTIQTLHRMILYIVVPQYMFCQTGRGSTLVLSEMGWTNSVIHYISSHFLEKKELTKDSCLACSRYQLATCEHDHLGG